MVWQPKRPADIRVPIAFLVAVIGVAAVIELGERKLISEEFVAYGCVGAVAVFAGYMMLSHLD